MAADKTTHATPVMIVTGASSGIGAATARLLARQGYRVVLAARRQDRLDLLAGEIQAAGGEALVVVTDIANQADIENLVEVTLASYGQIDVLLNNAGLGRLNWLEQLEPQQDIEIQIEVNLSGLIRLTRAVLPHMIARRQGHIIQMASIAAWIGTPTYSVYAATKFGLRGFSEALGREVAMHGIHVSSIYPGGVETEFASLAKLKRRSGLQTPAALKLTADQVAQAVWRVVRKPRRTLIIPGLMRWTIVLNTLFPGSVDWIIERRFTRIERGG